MSRRWGQGKVGTPSSNVIFEAPETPQPAKDHPGDIPLSPLRKHKSSEWADFGSTLPSLPYSDPHGGNRASSYGEIGTEYNPPTRGSTLIAGSGGSRKRGHYLSLSEAIADESQPDFDPERLYVNRGDNPDANSRDHDRTRSGPHISGGNGYGSYPNTPNYATQHSDVDFLKTPSPSLFPGGLPKPPRRHPFSQAFEAPKWKTLGIHLLLSLLAYPLLLIFVLIARGRTLFWTRVSVGAGCGIMGLLLGLSLVRLARRHLEAAAWATVIHQSRYHDNPGVRLKDLAPHAEEPVSAWTGFLLLWNRHTYPGTARKNRAHYDTRPWSIHVFFFLLLVVVSGLLPFLFARIVSIDTQVKNQFESYHEAAIKGDISEDDITRATDLRQPFNDFRLTWTLAPYSSHGGLPPVASYPWKSTQNPDQEDMVYFSETIKSQLLPDGNGFGTFETEVLTPSLDIQKKTSLSMLQAGLSPGSIVRQPRWGIRIKCDKLPDPQNNILPISANLSMTYVFLPKDTVKNLLDYFEKPFPTDFKPPAMVKDDQEFPSYIDKDQTLTAVNFYNNGVSHAYYSKPLYRMGEDETGFVSLEVVLIRLNTTFTPQGDFPVYGEPIPDINGTTTFIGYDAAVCVEVFEPWIVEVYNSTVGSPITLRIVEKSNMVKDFNTGSIKERREGSSIDDPNVRRELTSKRLQAVYEAAHTNSINQVVKDNGRDSNYVPSPIAVSYTTGQGPYDYTSLSIEYFEKSKALADANNILPYFAGSGSIVARIYPDRVLAYASISPPQMVIALVIIFLLGLVAALFVPRLPLSVPRRGFELYSWVAAFYADELVGIGKDQSASGDLPGNGEFSGPAGLPIGRRMEIEDIERRVGHVKFRYVP